MYFCLFVNSENICTVSISVLVLVLFFYLIPFITCLKSLDLITRSSKSFDKHLTDALLFAQYIKASSPKHSPFSNTFISLLLTYIWTDPFLIMKKQAPVSPALNIYSSLGAVARLIDEAILRSSASSRVQKSACYFKFLQANYMLVWLTCSYTMVTFSTIMSRAWEDLFLQSIFSVFLLPLQLLILLAAFFSSGNIAHPIFYYYQNIL